MSTHKSINRKSTNHKKTLKKSSEPTEPTEPTKPTEPFSKYRNSIRDIIRKSVKHTSTPRASLFPDVANDDDKFNENISSKYKGDGKYIPKFKIINSPAFASVVFSLEEGQCIYCNYASMNYCDYTIDISTSSQGIFRSLIRKFFTSSSYFLNYYTGMVGRNSVVSFGSYFPGDIIAMRIKKGESYIMSDHGFLCATPNVKISTASRLRNIIVRGENAFINEVSLMDDCEDDGMVWVASYGAFDKVIVNAGDSIKVNGGIFAFTSSKNTFTLTTEGNIKSFLYSGESILMRFRGPCELYLHSQNFQAYQKYLIDTITKKIRPTIVIQNLKEK